MTREELNKLRLLVEDAGFLKGDSARALLDALEHGAQVEPELEFVRAPLYDTVLVNRPEGGLVTFFRGVGGKSLRQTNMVLSGALPHPQTYQAEELAIHLPKAYSKEVAWLLANEGRLRFMVGAKDYWEGTMSIMDHVPMPELYEDDRERVQSLGLDLPFDNEGGYTWKANLQGKDGKPVFIPSQQSFRLEMMGFRPPVPVIVVACIGGLLGRETQ